MSRSTTISCAMQSARRGSRPNVRLSKPASGCWSASRVRKRCSSSLARSVGSAISTRCGGKTVNSMILVDSSVWIDHLRNQATPSVLQLRALMPDTPLLVGDLIICEVLRGCQSDREARIVERGFRRFEIVSLFDPQLAVVAASNYRFLRGRGITMAKLADLII